MNRITLITIALLISASVFGQSKKLLVTSVTTFRNHQMGMGGTEPIVKDGKALYPNQVSDYNIAVMKNEKFDQSPLSNKLDKFLQEEFFTGFPVELVPKSELLANEKYQSFDPLEVKAKADSESKVAGKLNKLAALSGESTESPEVTNPMAEVKTEDLADGYKSYTWGFPGNKEAETIRSYFPEADLFVYAIFKGNYNSSDYGKSSDFTCAVQLLMYKRGEKRNNKTFQFVGNKIIDDYTFEKYISEPDIDAIHSVREACFDSAIEKMRLRKEKRIEQFQKWLDK